MLHLSLAKIFLLIKDFGYAIIFPIAVLEGPIVSIIAGFVSSLGYLDPILLGLVLVAGDIVGDILYYVLGRWSRGRWMTIVLRAVGVTEHRLEKLERYFEKHDWKILLIGKTQSIGSAILLAAGAARMPFGKYIWYNLIGTIPKVLLFELIGYYFGRGYAAINDYLHYAGILSFVIAVVLLAAYLAVKRYLARKNKI